jgi:hypothetical protein
LNFATAATLLKRVAGGSRWIFGPAAVVFLIVAGWHARVVFASVLEQTDPALLVLTILLWTSLHLLPPLSSWIVLREIGAKIDYHTLLTIHVGRLPARYLPGGIWHTVSRVMDLHRLGVSRSQLSIMVLMENLVPVGVALTLGGLCLWVAGGMTWLILAAVLGGPALLAGIPLLLRHRVLLANRKFALRSYLKLTVVIAAFWIIAATAFYCYWSAFPAVRGSVSALHIYGIYLVAWVAGFVSVFAPQGIGVFEAVAGIFLQGTLTFAGATVLAAGFRVAILAADMLAAGLLFAMKHVRRAQLLRLH